MLSKILAAAAVSTTTNPFSGGASLSNAASSAYGGTAPTTTILQYMTTVIGAIFGLLGLVFLVLTLYAGYLWMTAMGEPKKVTKAKEILSQSVIGLIIMVLAYGISYMVVGSIGIAGGFGSPM